MESLRLVSFSKPCSLSRRGVTAPGEASRFRKWNLPEKFSSLRFRKLYVKNCATSCLTRFGSHHIEKARFSVCAIAGQPLEPDTGASVSKGTSKSIQNAVNAFYRFTRPHTIIGTTLSIISVSLLAVQSRSDLSSLFFSKVFQAVIASLMMNVYVVGLNQLTDIEIDKINKPDLPLASGEYSVGTGVLIVTSFVLMSFWVGWTAGSWPLFMALFVSFLLGTAYSVDLPFLRWKRFAVVAAFCIVAVRSVVVQLAFFLHIQVHAYKRPVAFPRPLIFATVFMGFFSTVISLFKDIPDIDGDQMFGIHSFSVRLGPERIFWTCITLLEVAYAASVLVGAGSPYNWSKCITIFGHGILGLLLWNRAKSVDLKSKADITSCYMFIWKLFYAEYLLIPFVR